MATNTNRNPKLYNRSGYPITNQHPNPISLSLPKKITKRQGRTVEPLAQHYEVQNWLV